MCINFADTNESTSDDGTNVFIISMQKNIGKRTLISNIAKKLHAMIWNGVDKSIYDKNGILLNSFGHIEKTRAAKEAKLNLFQYFLEKCKQEYLVLFEEDIILHKNFYEHYTTLINFANNTKFKLIYMGVSCCVPKNNHKSDHLSINLLPKTTYRFSGAYGVIIHRSIMQTMIFRSNDIFLYNKPFDIYTLGHIQMRYPNDCYVCEPQLVVPDISTSDIRNPRSQNSFWELCHIDKTDYIPYKSFPLYILADANENKIKQFIVILSMFIPYVKPIFICTPYVTSMDTEGDKKSNIIQTLYGEIYETMNVDTFSEEHIKKIIKHEQYALTNIYVNWTKNIENIFDGTSNILYEIPQCPCCSELKSDLQNSDCPNMALLATGKSAAKDQQYSHKNIDIQIYNGLLIIHNIKDPNIIKCTNKELFYTINCKNDMYRTMHH